MARIVHGALTAFGLPRTGRDKGCEYAVLVSMLEEDSELYAGITDVSHEYPKTFVVRPQFFAAIIALLRGAAQETVVVKAELEQIRKQNVDVTNFEADLEDVKSAFGRNYDLAKRKFDTAIDDIDKAIERLQKVKEGLLGSGKTSGSPTTRQLPSPSRSSPVATRR